MRLAPRTTKARWDESYLATMPLTLQPQSVRLFEMDLSSGKINRLTQNNDRMVFLSVSPEGKNAY